ncbi:hypothetical protein M7I_3336 [Glarea lozoyensis 74030]|uniref:Uncharacterized protein n=1 Tax=Glarea lozoyensis (strain ATCC 74030 / MF5533) TaxID=1104152 RepID=H0EL76_GLAL7|nr:hypothetical protein M7I_3336 [Glarea lozoyensis 74030]
MSRRRAQIKGVREVLEDPEHPGVYRWDFLDGYEGDEKNSLSHFPDLQQKVREVVEQGHIHPEDFNGDPEMNKLGEKGLHTKATMKKFRDAAKGRAEEVGEMTEKLASLEAEKELLRQGGTVRSGLSPEIQSLKDEIEGITEFKNKTSVTHIRPEGDEEEEVKPAKKKRATKAKVKKEADDGEEEAKPVKRKRAAKSKVKDETDDEEDGEIMPAKKQRGKKEVVKKEASEDEKESKTTAKQQAPTKGKVKKEIVEAEVPKAAPSTRKSRVKKEIKSEANGDEQMVDTIESEAQPPSAAIKKPRGKAAIKKEEEAQVAKDEEESDTLAVAAVPKRRTSRSKKMIQAEAEVESETGNVKKASQAKGNTKKGHKSAAKNDLSEGSDVDMNDIPEASADMKNGGLSSAQEPVVTANEEDASTSVPAPKTGRRSKRQYGMYQHCVAGKVASC